MDLYLIPPTEEILGNPQMKFELFEGPYRLVLKCCRASESGNFDSMATESINKPVEYGFSFGYGWRRIQKAFSDSGWDIRSTVPIRVHGSLARLLIHAEKK